MITPIDVLCLAIFVGLMALEGWRGLVPAFVDFLAVLGIAFAARYGFVPLSPYVGAPSTTFILIVLVLLGITAIISIFVSRRVKVQTTAFEATFGVILGMLTAAVLTYILFDWLSMKYGGEARIVKESVLYWQLHDFAGIKALLKFFRTLQGR